LPECRHDGRIVGLGNNLGVVVLARLLTRAPAMSAVRIGVLKRRPQAGDVPA